MSSEWTDSLVEFAKEANEKNGSQVVLDAAIFGHDGSLWGVLNPSFMIENFNLLGSYVDDPTPLEGKSLKINGESAAYINKSAEKVPGTDVMVEYIMFRRITGDKACCYVYKTPQTIIAVVTNFGAGREPAIRGNDCAMQLVRKFVSMGW